MSLNAELPYNVFSAISFITNTPEGSIKTHSYLLHKLRLDLYHNMLLHASNTSSSKSKHRAAA